MTAQELIARYVHAVTRHLPGSQRTDIAGELSALLGEEVAARVEAGEAGTDAARSAIARMGAPESVAQNYRAPSAVIEPRDTRRFMKAVGIGAAALCVLGISVILSDPAARTEPDVSHRIIDDTASVILQYLGVLVLVFWGAGAWQRRSRERSWSPDRLPPVPDPGAVNRPLTAIAVLFWAAGLAVLITGPASLFASVSGGAAPAPLIAAFTYDAEFQASRSLILWTVMSAAILTYAWPIVPGRRSAAWRRVDAVSSILVSLVLYALVLAGDVFAQEPANQYMKLAMAIFAGWGLIEGVSALMRERRPEARVPVNPAF